MPKIPTNIPLLEPQDLTTLFTLRTAIQQMYGFIAKAINNPGQVTVASLPPASANPGLRFVVTDSNSIVFHNPVIGGGANHVPVYSDGTTWLIG